MEQVSLLNLSEQMRIITTCALVAAAYLMDFLCCRLLIPVIRKIAVRTAFKWDNYLTGGKVLHNIFHLIPPVTFLVALPLLYPDQSWTSFVTKALYIYLIVIASRLVNEFISSLYAISSDSDLLRDKPMKGVYQMLKVLVICVAVILVLGVLLERNFTSLLAGLGASAAVLMLIFKDTILGLVAGVQLSAHDMLRPGDWIVMDKYGVNGTVEEVTLNTVKVRNWDNTIMTVPPYALVSDSFQNWRGMRESEGRRVARSLNIDVNSIRFCTTEELTLFTSEEWAHGLPMDNSTVNLGLFRRATEHYLGSMTQVNTDLRILVRQLEPTPEGLPVQIYFFTREKDWVIHEHIAADIIEHVIASLPRFGLRLFQKPTGTDIARNCVNNSTAR
ncbi:MAG TPA: mechanosensitive ion channel family protein [Candidatus Coprenecus pullistercoris]|nr:mechanosensitive ion channel family protein [Candidatus Coprenecus pullistercoris]